MSEEKVLTLRGKRAVWAPGGGTGPIDPKRLPEGYPYKEKAFEDIVWDGDTEGRVSIDEMGMYKVSDITPSAEQLVGATLVTYLPQSDETKEYPLTAEHFVKVTDELYGIGDDSFVIVATAPVSVEGMEFKEAGVYFADGSAERAYKLIIPETIQPMAEEFMPLLTSPNGTKYKLTVADDGTLSAVAQS